MPTNPYQNELQQSLGGASNTPPVDPRTLADLAAHRTAGVAAGNDMSWMDAPGATTIVGGQRAGQAPAGFDQKNWADPNMQSVKYAAGGFLNGMTKPSQIARAVGGADFQKRFPGATFDGKDRVNFNGAMSDGDSGVPVYDVDVLMGADKGADSSNGFWWGHDVPGMNKGPGGVTVGQGGPGVSGPMGNPASPGQSDLMAQILASLQDQQPDPQALLQQTLRY